MIHPAYTDSTQQPPKEVVAESLIEYLKGKDIYVYNTRYLDVISMISFVAIMLLFGADMIPYGGYGIIGIACLSPIIYFVRMHTKGSSSYNVDPIEHLRLQKEIMINHRAFLFNTYVIGTPILLILKLSSYYFLSTDPTMFVVAFSTGLILLSGIVGMIFSRRRYDKHIANAEMVLRLKD